MAPKTAPVPENYSFMSCILWIDTNSCPGWQKDIVKVLNSIEGVTSFRMLGPRGMVMVSGTVANPKKLIKKLGKKLPVTHIKFGQCPSNLFIPSAVHGGAGPPEFFYRGGASMPDFYYRGGGGSCEVNRQQRGRYQCAIAGNNAPTTRCRVAEKAVAPPPPPPVVTAAKGGGGCCMM